MMRVSLYTLYIISCLASPLAFTSQLTDWEEDKPGVNVCNGHYVVPEFAVEQRPETVITADETLLLQSGQSTLTGNVVIEEPERRLYANEVSVVRNDEGSVESAVATGSVLLEEPLFRVLGHKAETNFLTSEITLWDADYRWYPRQARGHAERAYTADDKPIYLYNASYTTCAPDDNLWKVKASEVILNDETGRGETWNTKMYLKDVPVMYLPYFNFPIDDRRQTGFLSPSYETSSNRGEQLTVPYYINLAPNYDATVTPSIMADRGVQTALQLRHLSNQFYTEFNGEFLGNDQSFETFRKDKLDSSVNPNPEDPRRKNLEDSSDDRWLVNFNSYGFHGPQWTSQFEYNEVSDDEYFIDFGANDFGLDERFLRQRAQANYSGDELTAEMYVQNYQTLQPFEADLVQEPYQVLPHIQTFYAPITPDQPFEFTNAAMASSFLDAEDPYTNEWLTDGQRYHLEPTLALPLRRPYAFFIPSLTVYETFYDLSLSDTDQALGNSPDVNRAIPTVAVDSGLIFERDVMYFKHDYIQTLEPRLFYLYTPFEDQNDLPNFDTTVYEFTTSQLFRKNRFAGIDRIADANQLSYAVTSRFYEVDSGIERFRGTIGQIYYIEPSDVTLCDNETDPSCLETENPSVHEQTSSIVGDALYRFSEQWSFLAEGRYDYRDTDTDLAMGRFQYQHNVRNLMHVGARYEQSGNLDTGAQPGTSESDLIQSDIGFSTGLTERTTLLGRWYYDLRNHFSVDMFGAVEYEACCFAVRVGARRYLQVNSGEASDRTFDNEYFVQWIFKGLGGLGSSPSDYAAETIPGYQDRFEVNNVK